MQRRRVVASSWCGFSYVQWRSAFSTPLLSGSGQAEPGRSLLSAPAKVLLIHAIRSVRPPGAALGDIRKNASLRDRGEGRNDSGACGEKRRRLARLRREAGSGSRVVMAGRQRSRDPQVHVAVALAPPAHETGEDSMR